MVVRFSMVQLRKVSFFLILMLVSLVLLVALLIAAFLSTPTEGSSWTSNMWNCMGDWMGGQYTTSNPYGALFGVSLIILVSLVVVGIGGVLYFQFLPEIKTTNRSIQQSSQTHQDSPPMGSVLKTLKEDEGKVVDVLINHDGKYLQKYIRKEAGLSRLKTHRVLARLAERGIVTLEKTGNTNEVRIADWLKKEENR
jgi:flagellar basal body-associated protein FliL